MWSFVANLLTGAMEDVKRQPELPSVDENVADASVDADIEVDDGLPEMNNSAYSKPDAPARMLRSPPTPILRIAFNEPKRRSYNRLNVSRSNRENADIDCVREGCPGFMRLEKEKERLLTQAGGVREHEEYSVLFIDEGRYAWIAKTDLKLFQGQADFEEMKKETLGKLAGMPKTKFEAEVKRLGFALGGGKLSEIWRRSVGLAEKVKLLTETQRLEQLIIKDKFLEIVPLVDRKVSPLKIKRLSLMAPKASRSHKRKLSDPEHQSGKKMKLKNEGKIKLTMKRPAKINKVEKEEVLPEKSVVACLTNDCICHECVYPIEEETPVVCSTCKSMFHALCHFDKQKMQCKQCLSGVYVCNICKSSEGNVAVQCCVTGCPKRYHAACAREQRLADDSPRKFDQNSYKCSLHMCHYCLAHDNVEKAGKGRLLQCLKCPTAYHMKDECIPAGCNLLSTKYLVCPKHLNRKEASCPTTHVNFDACFDCGKGGKLVCCEQCPMSYHVECLKMVAPPDKAWMCVECRIGRFPMFNDIMWVKYGAYRWWPCVVLHPLCVPTNVENKHHSVGEFAIRFLGSHDHAYVSHGRVFAYSEGDTASKAASGSKSMNNAFSKALEEAKQLLAAKKTEKAQTEADEALLEANVMPKYRALKANRHVSKLPPSRIPMGEYPVCSCKSDGDGCCKDDATCANKAMQIECHPQLCMEDCANQKFRLNAVPLVMPFQTSGRGWGLRSMVYIAKGDFVCEYMGDVISQEEVRSRWLAQSKCPKPQFYFLTLDSRRVIDAGPSGNVARFINHSCEPNLVSLVWQVCDDIRIGLFASRDVFPGDELTFHYNLDSLDEEVKIPCHCGTNSCIGYIGKRMSRKVAFEPDVKKKGLKKKAKTHLKKDKNCYRCKQGAFDLSCGRKTCPKVYHSSCLDLIEKPKGGWYCPWHYCDECEKGAMVYCTQCDNSYCKQHAEGRVQLIEDVFICNYKHEA